MLDNRRILLGGAVLAGVVAMAAWAAPLPLQVAPDFEARPASADDPSAIWRLTNAPQAIEASFGREGMHVGPDAGGVASWSWQLALAGAAPAEPIALGNRVEYRRPGLTEWYESDPRGVEHGFTIHEPLAGSATQLELLLAMSGSLSPSIGADALGLTLRDARGSTVLSYGGLHAYDATHRTLPARMELAGPGPLRITVDVADAVYPVVVDVLLATQVKKLVAADPDIGDRFGAAVSVDGDTAVVGAWRDGGVSQALGSAYVFMRNAGAPDNWGQVKKITPSDAVLGDKFGVSVSISGDTIVIGTNPAGGNGKAYVFERNLGGPNNWGQVQKLLASDGAADDKFGLAVAISGDMILVGATGDDDVASGSGSAYLFDRNAGGSGIWGQVKKLTAADPALGDRLSSSVSIDGDRVVLGANGDDDKGTEAGSAYVFERNAGGTGNWGQVKKLLAPDGAAFDGFGTVAVSGGTVVVGSSGDNVAGSFAGSAHVFERDAGGAGNWGYVKKLVASDAASSDVFGVTVTIDGARIVIGATGDDDLGGSSGAAYVFERDEGGAGNWGQAQKLLASDGASIDFFGRSLSLRGSTVVVGADEDDTDVLDAGSAYVFAFPSSAVCGNGVPESPEACDDGNTVGGDACAADCSVAGTGVPGGTSGGALLVSEVGSTIGVSFAPACSATDHAAYWGHGPIGPGGLDWSDSACGLGTAGTASFDPGVLLPGQWLYFVVVGYDGNDEGGYGSDSTLTPRPEAVGVGACDRPSGPSTCE